MLYYFCNKCMLPFQTFSDNNACPMCGQQCCIEQVQEDIYKQKQNQQ